MNHPSAPTTYPEWKAPAQDGGTLVWPEPAELLADTRANHSRLAGEESTHIQNIPLAEVRRRARQWVGIEDETHVVATGHQTELYHAGVWVKDALTNAAAGHLGGQAYHFAVDTDSPKHLSVRWPGASWPITDDPRIATAEWTGLLDGPTPAHLKEIERSMDDIATGWPFEPVLGDFLHCLRVLSLEEPKLSPAITNAMHRLDWSLGLRHHAMVVSPMFASEPYLVLVHHTLARAGAYARDYNECLAEYRKLHKIRTISRPMPDLRVTDEECEVPFWLDDVGTGSRRRAAVRRIDDAWALVLDSGATFVFDERADGWEAAAKLQQFLRQTDARLAPRALALTTYFRLLLCDQFVHGIGGGRYDQVTDALIARHFGMEPPKFSVTTATLYFPTAVGKQRTCLPCLAQEGHKIRHRALGAEKMKFVERINALPRRSLDRRIAFSEMHGKLAGAIHDHPGVRRWEETYREARERSAIEQALFDRELFYAIQPKERLGGLIAEYKSAFDGA